VRIVEREPEPTVHAEAFFSLAASYLSVGTGACRVGWNLSRPEAREAVQESEDRIRDRESR
jgi:hypothetical protein